MHGSKRSAMSTKATKHGPAKSKQHSTKPSAKPNRQIRRKMHTSSTTAAAQPMVQTSLKVQQLCNSGAVLATNMNLLPATHRKPITLHTSSQSGTTQPIMTMPPSTQSVDLFQIQDVANRIGAFTHQLDALTFDPEASITHIVAKTVSDNIVPAQLAMVQRNRTIVSQVPGAAYSNQQYLTLPPPKPTSPPASHNESLFAMINPFSHPETFTVLNPFRGLLGGGVFIGLENPNKPIPKPTLSVQDHETYQLQMAALGRASKLAQQWKQILSIQQQDLHQLKQSHKDVIDPLNTNFKKGHATVSDPMNENTGSDGTKPLAKTLTRLELWKQNLSTVLSSTASPQSPNTLDPKVSEILKQAYPLITSLLSNKRRITETEAKMTRHLVFRVLPSIHAQNNDHQFLQTKLETPLRGVVEEWVKKTQSPGGDSLPIDSHGNTALLAFSTIQQVQTHVSTVIKKSRVGDDGNSEVVTVGDSNNTVDEKVDEHLDQFAATFFKLNQPESNAPFSRFLTPSFKKQFVNTIQNDIYDNMSIEMAALYKDQVNLLPQFLPLARQLEELLDLPPFQPDPSLALPPSPVTKSSFNYHKTSSELSNQLAHGGGHKGVAGIAMEQQQQELNFLNSVQQSTKKTAFSTFETSILQREILLTINTINMLESCAGHLSGSLPQHVKEYWQWEQNEIEKSASKSKQFSDQVGLNASENDLMLTFIDQDGEYVYQGRKWRDIAANNMNTLLTNYEGLQKRVVDFHSSQLIELQQIVEQQLSTSHVDASRVVTASDSHHYHFHTSAGTTDAHQTKDASQNLLQDGQRETTTQYDQLAIESALPTFQSQQQSKSDQEYIKTAQQLNEIHTVLSKLLHKSNGPNDEQPTTNKTNSTNDLAGEIPLHKLKRRGPGAAPTSTTPTSTLTSTTTPPTPTPAKPSPLDFSDDTLHTTAQISNLVDTHRRLVRNYETNNKSHSFIHSRSLQPTTPIYTNAYALDIDGVLLKDGHILPGVKETMSKLFPVSQGGSAYEAIPTVFMTNGGGVTEKEKAAELSEKFGLQIDPNQIILASTPWKHLVPTLKDKRIAIIGGKKSPEVAKEYGFANSFPLNDLREQHCDLIAPQAVQDNPSHYNQRTNVKHAKKILGDVDAVMIWTDPRDWYVDLQVTLDILIQSRERTARELNIPIGSYKSDPHLLSTNYKEISENNHVENDQLFKQNPLLNRLGSIQSDIPSDFFNIAQSYLTQYQPLHTPILLSNPDFIYSNRFDKPRLAQGSFAETLSYLYTRLTNEPLEYLTCGKPTAMTYRLAEGKILQQAQNLSQRLSNRPVVISNIYGIGDNPAADIRGANWANSPWSSVFVHTGTIPLESGNKLGSSGLEKWAEAPALEYPSVNEAIHELETVHKNVIPQLTLKF